MDQSEISLIVSATDNASGVLAGLGGELQTFGARATALGTQLLPISVAAGVVSGSAIMMAADFEQAMNVLQVTSGASSEEMAALSETAIALGGDITLPGTSATDAAEAMLELSKAGLSVNDTMGAARGVLELAAAGELSNAEAATIAANALNAFGLSGGEASRVADLLAAAANASSADVRGMGDALQMAGSVAAMAGVPIEDTTTAIALMANAGISGSDAGTSLKQMLLSLMSPTDKARDLMDSLGISIYDADGQMRPLPDLVNQFSSALGPMTAEQRNAALATIFGSDAVRAANIVLMGGRTAWDNMSGAVNNAGAAQELAAAKTTGFRGMLDGLRSTMETVLMTGATPLLGSLTGLGNSLGSLISRVATANPSLVTAAIAFGGVLAVAGPLVLAIGFVATSLGALLAPVGLVILVVGLLAAAWATNFGGIQQHTANVLAFVQGIVVSVVGFVRQFIADAVTQTRGIWETTWTTIRSTVAAVMVSVRSIITTVLTVVRGFIATHGQEIRTFFLNAWTTISQIVQTVAQIISIVVTTVFGAIARFIQAHSAEIRLILEGAWNLIRTVISTVLGVIQGIVNAVLSALRGDWAGAWEAIKGIAQTVWEGIRGIIESALTILLGFFGTNLTEVQTKFTTIWGAVQTFLSTTWGAIQTTATTIWGAVQTFLSTTWGAIQTTADTVWTGTKRVILTPIEALETSINNTWIRIKTFAVDTWEDIKKRLTGIVDSLIGWISGAFAGFNIHIPLPHFNVSWNDIGFGISVPSVGVSWYKKGGDFIVDGATMIGVGEAGPERVQITPMDKNRKDEGKSITVNIHNPVVREEMDIRRIAAAVSEALGAEANAYGRMRYQWSQ